MERELPHSELGPSQKQQSIKKNEYQQTSAKEEKECILAENHNSEVKQFEDPKENEIVKSVYQKLTYEELKQIQQRPLDTGSLFVEAHSLNELDSKEQTPSPLQQVNNQVDNTIQFNSQPLKSSQSSQPEFPIKQQDSTVNIAQNRVDQLSKRQMKTPIQQPKRNVLPPVFVRVKSQEVKIENNKFQPIIQENQKQDIKPRESEIQNPKKKLTVTNNISLSINPSKQQENNDSKVSAQSVQQKGEEISTQKKKEEVQYQPLDIKTLSGFNLSSRGSVESIKPPSPKGQRKLKPWEMKKKSKVVEQSTVSELSTASVQLSTVNPPQILKNQIKQNQSNPILQQKVQNIDINASKIPEITKDDKEEKVTNMVSKAVGVQEEELKKEFPYLRSFTPADKSPDFKIYKQNKEEEVKEKVPEHHQQETHLLETHPNNSSHPLLRFHPEPLQQSIKDEKVSKDNATTPKLEKVQKQELIKNQMELENKEIKREQGVQPSLENLGEIQQRPLSQKLSISSNSVFEDDKLALELQKKKRLEELQVEIKKRRNIRDQLQISTPLGMKLLISAVVASVAGGTSYLLKRRKLSSIVSGVAAGVSTFLFIK